MKNLKNKKSFIFNIKNLSFGRINNLLFNFIKLNDFKLDNLNKIYLKNSDKIKFYNKKNYNKFYRNKNQKLKIKNIKNILINKELFNLSTLIKKNKKIKNIYIKLLNKISLYVDK